MRRLLFFAVVTSLVCGLLQLVYAGDDDYKGDPHEEQHPKGIPTRKNTPMREAEKQRKDKYDDLEMNKWPPDLWDRDKQNKDSPKE